MNLNDYLTRISYSAPLRVDLATLNGLIEGLNSIRSLCGCCGQVV